MLLTILDAAQVDSKQNAILAIKRKAPSVPLIAVVATRDTSELVAVHERSDATMTQIDSTSRGWVKGRCVGLVERGEGRTIP